MRAEHPFTSSEQWKTLMRMNFYSCKTSDYLISLIPKWSLRSLRPSAQTAQAPRPPAPPTELSAPRSEQWKTLMIMNFYGCKTRDYLISLVPRWWLRSLRPSALITQALRPPQPPPPTQLSTPSPPGRMQPLPSGKRRSGQKWTHPSFWHLTWNTAIKWRTFSAR